jgi:hypothetical protein
VADNEYKAPRQVVLFSGHMIDSPERKRPRFPADKEPVAASAIARTLDELNVGEEDLCICGGASGGDLLFAEAALARGARIELYLPFEEPTFFEKSVIFAGNQWRKRFVAVKLRATLHVLPLECETPAGSNAYEQNNLRMLEAAARYGAAKVCFICLWNGEAGDPPGGTSHLRDLVKSKGARTYWLDTRTLW